MSKLSDFRSVGVYALQGEPSLHEFTQSGEFIAPSTGFISILATGGGSSGDPQRIDGGDTIINIHGQWARLGGGKQLIGGKPTFSANWEYGQGNCFDGQDSNGEKNHYLQAKGGTAFAKTRETEPTLRKSNLRGVLGGGGGYALETTSANVYNAGGYFGGSVKNTSGGAGASIMVSQIIPVAEGDKILITIGAGGKTGSSIVAGDGGDGICIISFYGA